MSVSFLGVTLNDGQQFSLDLIETDRILKDHNEKVKELQQYNTFEDGPVYFVPSEVKWMVISTPEIRLRRFKAQYEMQKEAQQVQKEITENNQTELPSQPSGPILRN